MTLELTLKSESFPDFTYIFTGVGSGGSSGTAQQCLDDALWVDQVSH